MKKLKEISFSILDFEGPLKEFKRFGEGVQKWGQFCELEGEWDMDEIKSGNLKFYNFPLKGSITIKNDQIIESDLKFEEIDLDLKID